MMVTLMPFGVASEYSCRGCLPTGRDLSCVGPAIGRLMLAKLPPLALSQFHTLGGVYVLILLLLQIKEGELKGTEAIIDKPIIASVPFNCVPSLPKAALGQRQIALLSIPPFDVNGEGFTYQAV